VPDPYASTAREEPADVERLVAPTTGRARRGGHPADAAGEISQVEVDGWVQEYFLKALADYRVMAHVVRHSRLPDPAAFVASEAAVGDGA
jgi:hypothetical protein